MKKTIEDIKAIVLNGEFTVWQDFKTRTLTFDNQEFSIQPTKSGAVWLTGDGHGSLTNYGCGPFTVSIQQIEQVLGYKLHPTEYQLQIEINQLKGKCVELAESIKPNKVSDFCKTLLDSEFHYKTLSTVLCLTAFERDCVGWKQLFNKVKTDIR